MNAWIITRAFLALQSKAECASMSRSLALDICNPDTHDKEWLRWDNAETRYLNAMERLRTRLMSR